MSDKKLYADNIEKYFSMRAKARPANSPVRIDFMSHRHTFWHCHAPLMLECKKRDLFSPRAIVGVCTDATCDSKAHEIAWLEQHGIPWMHLSDYVPAQEKADVMCFSTPYPHTYGKAFFTTTLTAQGTRAVLIPYCTEWLGGGRFLHGYFTATLPFWRIFTASTLSQMYYHQYQDMPFEYAPVTGNPEFDVVRHWQPLSKYQHILDMARGRKIVLWTPHYDVDGPYQWSTWNSLSEKIIYLLGQHRDDIFVVLRPHHFLRTQLESWSQGQVPENSFHEAAQSMHEAGNFWIDVTGQSIECVHACTALISDCSSMLAKALALGKVVCYTPSKNGDGAPEIAKLLEGVVTIAPDVANLHHFIQKLVDNTFEDLKAPEEIVQYLCGVADGQAAVRMADHLEEHFLQNNVRKP